MKYQSLFVAFCTLLTIVSCGNDDEPTTPEQPQTADFFPVNANNYWIYDVPVANLDGTTQIEKDSLYFESINGNEFTLGVDTSNVTPAFTNTMLTSGTLTKQGNTLRISSSLNVPIDGITAGISFTDLVLLDTNAAAGDVLFTQSDTFSQIVQTVPLTVNYTLSSKKVDELDSLTFSSISYPTVEVFDVIIEMSVGTTVDVLGIPTTIPIIDTQEVLNIRSYFAANVGIVKSDTLFSYQINATTIALLNSLNINIGLPTADSEVFTQELFSHFVAN